MPAWEARQWELLTWAVAPAVDGRWSHGRPRDGRRRRSRSHARRGPCGGDPRDARRISGSGVTRDAQGRSGSSVPGDAYRGSGSSVTGDAHGRSGSSVTRDAHRGSGGGNPDTGRDASGGSRDAHRPGPGSRSDAGSGPYAGRCSRCGARGRRGPSLIRNLTRRIPTFGMRRFRRPAMLLRGGDRAKALSVHPLNRFRAPFGRLAFDPRLR